jgi:hypothetical protein
MRDDSNENLSKIEQKLIYSFGLVNDWLKFAEAKNAALVTLSGATVFGLLSYTSSAQNLSLTWKIGIFAGIALQIIACLVSLASFLPKISRLKILGTGRKTRLTDNDNLLFFGDLCKYSSKELVNAVAHLYFQDESYLKSQHKAHLDIADQIIINSRIAVSKFRLFKIALWIAVASIPVIFIVTTVRALLTT